MRRDVAMHGGVIGENVAIARQHVISAAAAWHRKWRKHQRSIRAKHNGEAYSGRIISEKSAV